MCAQPHCALAARDPVCSEVRWRFKLKGCCSRSASAVPRQSADLSGSSPAGKSCPAAVPVAYTTVPLAAPQQHFPAVPSLLMRAPLLAFNGALLVVPVAFAALRPPLACAAPPQPQTLRRQLRHRKQLQRQRPQMRRQCRRRTLTVEPNLVTAPPTHPSSGRPSTYSSP